MAKFISTKPKPRPPSKTVSQAKETVSKVGKRFSFLKWLDPFTYVDLFVMPQVKKFTQSSVVEFLVNAGFALVFAFIIYSLLGAIFNSASPLVVVYSGSMEPTLYRGDILALKNVDKDILSNRTVFVNNNIAGLSPKTYVQPTYDSNGVLTQLKFGTDTVDYKKDGPIVVYPAYNPYIPSIDGKQIIHRGIVKIVALDGNFILTKGDNDLTNKSFDEDLGITLYATPVNSIIGQVFLTKIPAVGCVKLWIFDDLPSLLINGALPSDFQGIC